MRISAALPPGVAALLFEAARRRREVEEALAGRLAAAGFSEVILPVLDYFEPYEPLLSPAGRGELYRFVDRDGELLALRADFTPMLARLLAPLLAAGPGSLPLPLRLFYRGDVVRYGEERAGRARELFQVGAELVGEAGEGAEAEMLGLFLELLCLALSASARESDRSAAAPQVVLGFAGALDHPLAAAGGAEPRRLAAAVARRERAPLRDAPAALLEVVEHGVPRRPAELGSAAAARLDGLLALRAELAGRFPGVDLAVDLAEFAGQTLDPALAPAPGSGGGERLYYDGLVFRAHAGPAGTEVGGGGRYDRLFRALGAEVPALGFSLGLDRLPQPAASGAAAEPTQADPILAEAVR